jgi:hypothetical protein
MVNEFFCLLANHNMLQNVIYVFTMYSLPSFAQQICNHCDEFMQIQVGKPPIVTSSCLIVLGMPDVML